jgi:PKD domain
LISALYALAGGGHGLSVPSLALYGHLDEPSALYDVSEGANGFCGGEATSACGDPNATYGQVDCEGTTACNAAPGFDGPSGVGAPRGLGAFEPALPHAAIAPPSSLRVGIPASFSAAASSEPNPGAAIAGYIWSWGDGSPDSGGVAPSHTYAVPGRYQVSLVVTDDYGLSSQASSLTVAVGAEGPTVEAHSSAGEVAGFQLALAPPIPDVQLVGAQLTESASGRVVLRLRCPARVGRCSGSVALHTRGPVSLETVAGGKGKPVTLTLGKGSFAVPGGHVQTLKLRLSGAARALLGRVHVLHLRVTILAHDAAGASHTTRSIAVLHAAARGSVGRGG